jgi:signal transduction histidine kinase
MNSRREPWFKRLPALFEIPALDSERSRRRIRQMECNIMVPAKIFIIGLILYSFSRSPWAGSAGLTDVVVETVQGIFWFYIAASAVLAGLLLARLPLAVAQWAAVTNSLVDAVFLAAMTLLTGGLDSILFWLFLGLILRNTVSVPPGVSQLILNFLVSLCFAFAVVLDAAVMHGEESAGGMFDLSLQEDWGEPLALRMVVLWLMTLCCSGLELLLERQRLATEEAAEFAARESQLHSAGRLAAEFAHQIKNPLGIISNAAHSIARSLREKKPVAAEHIEIIQEEVARVDRVVTQILGYAQLSEGHVEKLEVVKSIEAAIAQVFPPALPTGIRLKKNYSERLPPLLMQRGHLTEILVNLLTNAREALGDEGTVTVTADGSEEQAVEISVADDGPGIPPDRLAQIFEAYFTTKPKGTGLGLAIVKHNVELYGGTVRVESKPDAKNEKLKHGNGATFRVIFPAKAPAKPIIS